MDLIKLLLSDKSLKAAGLLLLFSMLYCLRYWTDYYNQFSLDILSLVAPSDFLGLGLGKLRFTIQVFVIAAVPLGGLLFQMWANPNSGRASNAIGCMAGLAVLWLFLLPGVVVERAAKNDARLVRNGGKPSMISTVDTPLDVGIDGKDGSHSERCRWIGATTNYIFVLGPDTSLRVIKRDEIKTLNFFTPQTSAH